LIAINILSRGAIFDLIFYFKWKNINTSVLHLLGGASIHSRWIVTRILGGTWCLSCFFLVQIYCCTLTSHLTMPHSKPIINSVNDIQNVSGLQITVDRNLGAEKLISVKIFMSNIRPSDYSFLNCDRRPNLE
jgi:hypothetical protein